MQNFNDSPYFYELIPYLEQRIEDYDKKLEL